MQTNDRIAHLLAQAIGRPRLFAARVLAVGLAAYAATFLVLLILVLLLVTLTLMAMAPFFIVFAWYLLVRGLKIARPFRALKRALVPSPSAPDGNEVEPETAPLLFGVVAEGRRFFRLPEIASIRLISTFTIGLTRIDRRGLVGWREDHLLLGHYLLYVLTPEELHGLILHALALRTGRFKRLSGLVVPVLNFWSRLKMEFDLRSHWTWNLLEEPREVIVGALTPYFYTLSILAVLDADRRAAALVGSDVLGRALLNVFVTSTFIETIYVPERLAEMRASDEPPTITIEEIHRVLRNGLDRERAKIWLNEAMTVGSIAVRTMPTLAVRLARLGVEPVFAGLAEPTAAEHFFGESLGLVETSIDGQLSEWSASAWRRERYQVRESRMVYEEMEARVASGTDLTPDEMLAYGRMVESRRGPDAAEEIVRALVERCPRYGPGSYELGRLLLLRDDDRGIAYIERAVELDRGLVLAALPLLYSYLTGKRRYREADGMVERYRDGYHGEQANREQIAGLARQERAHLRFDDAYLHHDLSGTQLARVIEIVRGLDDVEQAFVMRKLVQHLRDRPLYVLVVVPRRRRARREEGKKVQWSRVVRDLSVVGEFRIVVVDGGKNRPMYEEARRIAGSRLPLE